MKVCHQLPGRIRVRLSEAEIDSRSAGELESLVRRLPEVYSANFTPQTNTLLIYHERSTSEVTANLKSLFEPKRSIAWQAASNLVAAFMFERSLKHKLSPFTQGVFLLGSFLELWRLNPQVFKMGTKQLLKRKPTADSLTMISVLAAYGTRQPLTATTVMIMSGIADHIGDLTDEKSRQFLQRSLREKDLLVHRVTADKIETVPLKRIKVGDRLHVYTGEQILVDGEVTAGHAQVNEAGITGEFQAAPKKTGDQVYASTVVESGQLELLATKLGAETEEAAIYQLLQEAEENKSELQKVADRLAQKMVLLSFGAAALTYGLKRNLAQAIGVLVVDFVCGVKLSSEVAILTTMNRFTKQGVVIKGGRSIENAAKVKEVVFDKTGTLTTGRPEIQKLYPAEDVSETELLQAAAYAEQHANHPLSRVIVKAAAQLPLPELALSDEENRIGYGIIAQNYHDQTVVVGSDKLMKQQKIDFSEFVVPLQAENKIYVALDQKPLGVIVVDDAIRNKMAPTIQDLKQHGIEKLTMLTGDKSAVAENVASTLGLTNVHSRLLPQDKVNYVKAARKDHPVMMIGDGLNDSAALKWSDVGVTIGQEASDAAKSAGDILIQADQPEIISEIVAAAQKTMQTIEQNYRIVFLLNSAAIGLSVAGKINPIVGSIIHNSTTIGVILRSLVTLNGERRGRDGRAYRRIT